MKYTINYKSINQYYLVILIILLIIILYSCLKNDDVQEPFVTYLNSKKNELFRNLRYKSQYVKQNFNNYIRRIKKLF